MSIVEPTSGEAKRLMPNIRNRMVNMVFRAIIITTYCIKENLPIRKALFVL